VKYNYIKCLSSIGFVSPKWLSARERNLDRNKNLKYTKININSGLCARQARRAWLSSVERRQNRERKNAPPSNCATLVRGMTSPDVGRGRTWTDLGVVLISLPKTNLETETLKPDFGQRFLFVFVLARLRRLLRRFRKNHNAQLGPFAIDCVVQVSQQLLGNELRRAVIGADDQFVSQCVSAPFGLHPKVG
jgi:hypothetical protein